MRFFSLVTWVLAILITVVGCSGNRDNPVANNSTDVAINNLPVGVSDFNPDGTPYSGMAAMGLFNMHVDPVGVSAELSAIRNSALTDVLEVVDITNFLSLAPCFDCVKIQSVALDDDGFLVVSIGIKHPFGVGDPLKPITGKNRADLHVFNIEGIVVSNAPAISFAGVGQSVAGFALINADGYTGYLDGVLDDIYPTDATIHPYITFFDDYDIGNFDAGNPMGFDSVTDPPPSGNLVMAMGCDYNYQDYVFGLIEPVDFIFAVGCTYAVSSANKHERFSPEYRIPQHNKKAASEIAIEITNNQFAAGVTDSTADIEVRVVDINHDVAVGDNLDEMFVDSSVDDIWIDIPQVLASPAIIDGNNSISGTGHSSADPLVYTTTLENSSGADEGTYPGIVKVSDNYAPGQNESPLLNSMDGIERVGPIQNPLEGLFHITEFATYQTFIVDVAFSCDPPVPTSIDPANITINPGLYNDVTILGNYFTGSGGVTQVYLDDSVTQIYADDINVSSDTELTCDFDVSSAAEGTYDLVVFTACEGRGIGMVEITSWYEEWACLQYNSYNLGSNPNPQAFDHTNYSQSWYVANSGFKYASPVVTENYVYVTTNYSYYSSSTSHRITCYDINNNGAVVWENYINPTGEHFRAHTSPCWFDDGEDGKVVVGGDRVWCFDAVDGSTEWEYGESSCSFIGQSPKYYDGKIVISGNVMVHCIDADDGSFIWTSESWAGGNEGTPAVVNDRVYIGRGKATTNTNRYTCLDMADGSTIWQRTDMPGTSHWAAPYVTDGRLYYSSYYQHLMCLNADTGDTIWEYTDSSSAAWVSSVTSWVDPSDSKRVIYFSGAFSSGGIWAIKDQDTYAELFWRSPSFYCDASPVFNNGVVYAGEVGSPCRLRGFDCETGAEVFTQTLNGAPIRSAIGFAYDRMIVTNTNGVFCFE
ncbi:PQQ-binding-like beta-propeller repeat protein [bacterium]|nr:PQQ-binding-like beta-propeller repeat protein [bacterium]